METASKMKQRHKHELRNLEKELKQAGKKAKGGKAKAAAQAEAAKRREALATKQASELAALQGAQTEEEGGTEAEGGEAGASPAPAPAADNVGAGGGAAATGAGGGAGAGAGGSDAATAADSTPKPKKLSKAQRRRLRKQQEEEAREARIAEAKATAVDYRQVEIDAITKGLESMSLSIKHVKADGNCLFRSIADQLELQGVAIDGSDAVAALRQQAAEHMRAHADDYAPFLEYKAGDNAESDPAGAFEAYCERMASTVEWGGQAEVKALAEVYDKKIVVYQATGEALEMGKADDASPLRVSFHRHYYALGYHYNSVEPAQDA